MYMRMLLLVWSAFFATLTATAQVPTVTLSEPVKDALVGDTVKFCVVFENSGGAPGYGPFIDLAVPRDLMNGNSPCDGISIVSAKVTSTTPNVPLTPLVGSPGGCTSTPTLTTHPLAPQVPNLTLPPGMELVTLALPFGSYQPLPQPPIMVEVTAQVHAWADVGAPLVLYARGGFRYGGGPSGSPNAAIVVPPGPPAWPETETITPQVVIVRNTYAGADLETVAGPNFPRAFNVTVDVAPGQTLNGLAIKECLSAGGQWGGAASISPPATVTNAPPCFTATWTGPVTGTGAGTITMARDSTVDNSVLGTASCKTTVATALTNTATITGGTWQPADPNDSPGPLSGTSLVSPPVDVRALAIQKVPQPGPTIPGSLITYAARFQVSDYQRFGNLTITDTMLDGLSYLSASLTVTDKLGTKTIATFPPNFVSSGQFVLGNYKCPGPPAGSCTPPGPTGFNTTGLQSTRRVFNISGALVNAGHSGILTGGLWGGTSTIPAQGTLTIRLRVLDKFLYPPRANTSVDKDDPLLNRVDIKGTVPGGGIACSDDGFSCLAVPTDILNKVTVAVNHGYLSSPMPLGGPSVTVGDEVTFKLWKRIPSSDYQSMSIEDWGPLPVLPLSPVTLQICNPTPPTLATMPHCVDSPFPVPPPALPAPDNSLTFNFGFSPPSTANQPGDIQIFTTHTVSNLPFPDGLLLTNEAQECEDNSWGMRFCQAAIAQFRLQEPFLKIDKLACGGSCQGGHTNANCPACPAGGFNPATVGGKPMIYADANDTVEFALIVTNSGTGPNGAFDVEISDDLVTFPGVIDYTSQFCVTRGDGAVVPWTFVSQLPTKFRIRLTNPIPAVTAPNNGNVILIRYKVNLNAPQAITNGCYTNKGHIEHYANQAGGPDFVSAGFAGPDASAEICVRPHGLNKQVVWGSEPDPQLPNVAIGERIDYELSYFVPEGTLTFTVNDALPPGIQMVAGSTTVTASGFTPNVQPVFTGTLTAPAWTFTNLINPKKDAFCERMTIKFRAQVMNQAVNNSTNPTKTNKFSIGAEISNQVDVFIVEPKLSGGKTVTLVPAGGVMKPQYQVTIANNSNATAFNITVVDTLPACVTLPTNVTVATSPPGLPWSGPAMSPTIASLKPGQSATITFFATQACKDCSKLENKLRVQWTSLPGLNGTNNATPGASCSVNGERCGNGSTVNQYFFTATASLCGKVCGIKYADLNGNGVRDPNEPPLAGWPITSGTNTTSTDASGSYCITRPPGTYSFCEGTFPNWVPTQPPVTPPCVLSTVVINTTNTVNFGNLPRCSAKLCGKKTTPNGQPVAGWTITATPGGQGGPIISATTAADGSYCMLLFGGTGASYTITETPKTGWLQLFPPSGSYQVKVECQGTTGLITGIPDPLHADFVNRNVCAGVTCPLGTHCEVGANGGPVCVKDNINTTQ